MIAIVPCFSCEPLAAWLAPWVVAGALTIFVATVAWAFWTKRR